MFYIMNTHQLLSLIHICIRCRSALDGLETLLQSLLEISKMETGLIQINKKKLPLMATLISAVNCTYPKADEKEIEFVFDYAKELETCMVCLLYTSIMIYLIMSHSRQQKDTTDQSSL